MKNLKIAIAFIATIALTIYLTNEINTNKENTRREKEIAEQEIIRRKIETENQAKKDSITAEILRETAERKRIEELRIQDSILKLQNEQSKIEHRNFAFNRINLFGQKFMKEVSPSTSEALTVIVDTANCSYNDTTKITTVFFRVKWMAYMYGIFRNEPSKSEHEYFGKYTLMGNYDEYIETIYQNYALLEGINSNEKFSRTMKNLSNVAEILDKVDKIDRALKSNN